MQIKSVRFVNESISSFDFRGIDTQTGSEK